MSSTVTCLDTGLLQLRQIMLIVLASPFMPQLLPGSACQSSDTGMLDTENSWVGVIT